MLKVKVLFFTIIALTITSFFLQFHQNTPDFLWKMIVYEVDKEKNAEISLKKRHQTKQEILIKKLTRRVGPERALEILNKSEIPKDATSHFLSHKIGEETYKIYGNESLTKCVFDDLNGCVHGLIITAIEAVGFDGVFTLVDNCQKISPYKFKMCVHGAGHAFLAFYGYNINSAMTMCDSLALSYPENKNITQWCGSGLFMENVHGEHNGITPKDHPFLSRDNLMYPCNEIPEQYKKGCYQTIAGWWNILFAGDLVKTASVCDQVPTKYQPDCADNIGRLANSTFGNNIEKIDEYCRLLKGSLYDHCLKAEARNLFSVGQREIPFQLCSMVKSMEIKNICYMGIFEDIKDNLLNKEDFKSSCQKWEKVNPRLCN